MSQTSFADNGEAIELQSGYNNPILVGNGVPKSPKKKVTIYIDGHTIYFENNMFENYFLTLFKVEQNGDTSLVYSDYIPAGATYYKIPDAFIGEYIIKFSDDSIYYTGEIEIGV